MDCEQALLLISSQIDHEIEPDQRAPLDAHLRECPSCQTTMDAFRLQHEELRHAFVARRGAAAEVAERVSARLPAAGPARVERPYLRRAVWGLALAASVAGIAAFLYRYWPASPRPEPGPTAPVVTTDRLTAKPRVAVPPALPLAVGEALETKQGERRRTTLPDGSVVYLNQNTTVRLESERRLKLEGGEVYVEVTPRPAGKDGSPFVVKTAGREVTALGTKFAVRAEGEKANVVVTQGQVWVTGYDGIVQAGQQLAPDAAAPVPAPRVSHALDWAGDLMAHAGSPLVPASQYGGGALIAVDPSGQEAKLSLRKYHIDVYVEDGFARTTIDQTYFNHESTRLEGTFYFPLPPDASLSRLAMYVDGNLMEGGMVERNHGRAVYQEIVDSQKDPALLEWLDGSTFKMRVFPLEGRQEKRIVLSYTQKLPTLYGKASYRFPAGHSLEAVRDWSFHARVKNGFRLDWTCDSHTLKATRAGADLLLDARAEQVKVDRDVQLALFDARDSIEERARFSSFEHEGARYLMLRQRPALTVENAAAKIAQGRHWVFLFESSGDRDPLLARVQIDVIQSLLEHVEHADTFAVLTAGTRVHAFASQPLTATPENVKAAVEFLERAHLIGALDLGQALKAVEPFARSDRETFLVHVGSGVAALGERREDVLAKRVPEGMRYVGVGVGKRWARGLMKAAAEGTGGHFTQINPDEPIVWRAFDLFATLNTPRLLDVKVVDGAGRTPFLGFGTAVCQGEELCAIARIEAGEPMPESVIVGGTMNGQVFRQVIPVKDVAADAGYLPRTWAKLEIERLLAEDAVKHKDRLIALSKAMYVMTPFTSLLVLENEAMYAQYKVDRGRKDHWAMYPCPQKILVVYEPDPLRPVDPRATPQSPKPQANEVLQTVLLRVSPRSLTWPGQNDPLAGQQVLSAADYSTRAYDTLKRRKASSGLWNASDLVVLSDDLGIDPDLPLAFNGRRLSEVGVPDAMEPARLVILSDGTTNRVLTVLDESRSMSVVDGERANWGLVMDPHPRLSKARARGLLRDVGFAYNGRYDFDGLALSSDGRNLAAGQFGEALHLWDAQAARVEDSFMEGGMRDEAAGRYDRRLNLNAVRDPELLEELVNSSVGSPSDWAPLSAYQNSLGFYPWTAWENGTPDVGPLSAYQNSLGFYPPEMALVVRGTSRIHTRIPRPITTGGVAGVNFKTKYMEGEYRDRASGRVPQMYGRPSFRSDERIFTDLVAYAPGMNTTRADIQATLEAEAAPNPRVRPGRIDPAARTLIDKARTAGWQKLTVTGEKDEPGLTVVFDGAGRYAFERVLPLGLRERVVCDGVTLLHLYPDLGVGARRTVSRFHRVAVVPWLLPPVDDLAHGADVECVNEKVVALSPRGAADAKDKEGKSVSYLRTELVFGADGRLSERRWVEMPANKVHLRETYDAAGVIKVFDAKDKELATHKLNLATADEPDLKPDVSRLVVLPLPFRSRPHVYAAYGLAADQSLHSERNGCLEYLEPAEALEVLAAEFAARDGQRAREVVRRCFHAKDDRRLGFCTLLASAGVRVGNDRELAQVLCEHPGEPLAAYLALDNGIYRTLQRRQGLNWGAGIGPRDHLLTRLAAFRDRWLRWEEDFANRGDRTTRRAEQQRALEFVRQNKTNVFGLALLAMIQERARSDEEFHRDLAATWRLLDDGSGLAYTPNYEHARNLYTGGKKAEAAAAFRELYVKAFDKGLLPPIDSTFRQALQLDGEGDNGWDALMRQTAARLLKDKERAAIVTLAWQCRQVGDRPLSDNLLRLALDGITDEEERLHVTLTAVAFLHQTGQHAEADQLLEPLLQKHSALTDDKAAARRWGMAQLWRLASQIAEQRGLTAEAIRRLEEALEIEYRWGPDVINLERLRADYGKLLDHYQSLADAVAALKLEPPADLTSRTVRAADRWRALDRVSEAPCQKAAHVLRTLGARELAWEYLTTPLGQKPGEADPWVGLARTLSQEGSLDLADLAYAAAFDAEPTNGQVLWDRAQNLQQAGKVAESQQVLRQLADGRWLPRYRSVQDQARWQLRGR